MTPAEITEADAIPWCDSLTYCERLYFAGHYDWRLPNILELESLVDYGRPPPTIDPVFGAAMENGELAPWYLSSTSFKFSTYAWSVSFSGDRIAFPDSQGHVRAVRRNRLVKACQELPRTGANRCFGPGHEKTPGIPCDSSTCPGQDGFYQAGCAPGGIWNGDGTVTDFCTGLMWQERAADTNGDGLLDIDDELPWDEALQYCANLTLGGYDDWRLPNIRECISLLDYGVHSFMLRIGGGPTDDGGDPFIWSSTTDVSNPPARWAICPIDGDVRSGGGGFVQAVRNAR